MSSPTDPGDDHDSGNATPSADDDGASDDATGLASRAVTVGIVVALAFALIGWITTTSSPGPKVVGRQGPLAPPRDGHQEKAPSYSDLRDLQRGPNGNMYVTAIPDLQRLLPVPTDTMPTRTEEARARSLGARAQRRSFGGAPPTIPHPVDPIAMPNCLACHEHGARVADKVAPVMSHPRLESCTQCHVTSEAPPTLATDTRHGLHVTNSFVGLPQGARGERALLGAPPTIPHTTFMRETCSACHGVSAALGMRTPHVVRQSCTQCHAPSAVRDQRPLPVAMVESR